MNEPTSPLGVKQVIAAYQAKFDDYPRPMPGVLGEWTPLKWAANHGAVDELTQRMQAAINSGKPMNFGAFVQELSASSGGTAQGSAVHFAIFLPDQGDTTRL